MPCVMGSASNNQFGDYNRYILDLTEDKVVSTENSEIVNDPRWMINNTFLPETIKFKTYNQGAPTMATVKLYKEDNDIIDEVPEYEYQISGSGLVEINTNGAFPTANRIMYLVEFQNQAQTKKVYRWMPRYEVERSKIILNQSSHDIVIDFDEVIAKGDPTQKPETPEGYDAIFIDGNWWLNKNLGASSVEEAGDGYQWGRNETFSLSTAPSVKVAGPVSSHSEITAGTFYTGNLWQVPVTPNHWNSGDEDKPEKTSNDPSPEGWRIPTLKEMQSLIKYYQFGEFESGMKRIDFIDGDQTLYLPVTGTISSSGSKYLPNWGIYWTSSLTSGGVPRNFAFNPTAASGEPRSDYISNSAVAAPIRCIQDLD